FFGPILLIAAHEDDVLAFAGAVVPIKDDPPVGGAHQCIARAHQSNRYHDNKVAGASQQMHVTTVLSMGRSRSDVSLDLVKRSLRVAGDKALLLAIHEQI